MFVNRFARAFSLHDVLGDIEGLGSSTVSNAPSQSVFHEVSSFSCRSVLSCLDATQERARLATFKDWPHSSPSAAMLAKAGLIFVPTSSYPDQCKCFACLKLFSDWEPGDAAWNCHCTNSPLCPFVCSALEADRLSDTCTPASSSDFVLPLRSDSAEIHDESMSLRVLSCGEADAAATVHAPSSPSSAHA